MRRRKWTLSRSLCTLFAMAGAEAQAQSVVSLADEIIVISQGQRGKEAQRQSTTLGAIHGSVERPLGAIPGTDKPRLGIGSSTVQELDVLSAAARPMPARMGANTRPGIAPPPVPTTPLPPPPIYGPIDLPTEPTQEGPPNGLSLDQAIGMLIHQNPDLAIKAQELPKAQADILTAGLWGNPMVFATAGSVPYGSYTPTRTGSNTYGITLIQPFDVNGKIRARTELACQAKRVLEAQYQDAVRLEIENLHVAFVGVLSAQTTVDYQRVSLRNYEPLYASIESKVRSGAVPESDLDAAMIQREMIANALDDAELQLRQAKKRLALFLGIPPEQSDQIEVQGSLLDDLPPLPPAQELIPLALANRPDVAAFRLAIRSATANVEVQRRDRFPDVFALWSPYEFTANNDVYAHQAVTSWSGGVFGSIPILNRNQGNIHRAEHNVRQTQMELDALQRRAAAEVGNALLEYETTRRKVDRFRQVILPRARHQRDDKQRLYLVGQAGIDVYLNAQRDYNDTIQAFRNVLVRHRLAMLRVNTVVGLRLLP